MSEEDSVKKIEAAAAGIREITREMIADRGAREALAAYDNPETDVTENNKIEGAEVAVLSSEWEHSFQKPTTNWSLKIADVGSSFLNRSFVAVCATAWVAHQYPPFKEFLQKLIP